ncbi:hypothetical protein ACS0TY_005913 [Phlomoides rotata]
MMLGVSSIGLNNTTFHIDALPEVWAAHIKMKTPNTNKFCTADVSSFNVGESSSTTKDKGKGVKRKQVDDLAVQFIDTMGTLCDMTDSRFGHIADTMGSTTQRVGSEFDACKKCGHVYDHLGLIDFLTVEAMNLFFSLPDDVKTVLVKRIMKKLDDDECRRYVFIF